VTRSWQLKDEVAKNGISAYFATCNSGKQSIAVNLADSAGVSLLHKLAAKADIVVASYKPGDAEKLGVDADTLHAINPSLIYAQITGYGVDDPRSGYDAVIQAETGFQGINGSPEGGPNKMPVPLTDELAGHQVSFMLPVYKLLRLRLGMTTPSPKRVTFGILD
jgi:crotonobetainyl-CoA:carnitine CoA-transferase CaiB-like acyl-CoA transferase